MPGFLCIPGLGTWNLEALPLERFPTKPTAFRYGCPKCGDIWASFESDGRPVRYQFIHANCPNCGGGSLRLWNNFPFSYLPEELLAREIDLMLTHQENYEYVNHRN